MAKPDPQCIIPWTSLYLHSNGKTFPCCMMKTPIPGSPEQSLLTTWHSPEMISLRKGHLAHEPVPQCGNCWFRENKGLTSRRTMFEYLRPEVKEPEYSLTPSLNSILHYDISFGNLCNLSCLFCGPDKSSKWQNLLKELPEDPVFIGQRKSAVGIKPIDSEKLIEDVLSLTNLLELEIKGGEPLIHPAHNVLLKKLIQAGRASKLKLLYSTNLTHLTEETLELWSEFSGVSLALSIDGTEEYQTYIRGPGASLREVVLPNIEKLRRLDNTSFTSHTTICAYNFFNLEELLNWLHLPEVNVTRNSFGIVRGPAYLSPFVHSKQAALPYIDRLKGSEIKALSRFANNLKVSEFEVDPRLKTQFEHFTGIMDKRRGVAWRDLQAISQPDPESNHSTASI